MVQTPWHPDDLRVRVVAQEGRIETGGRWREVVMAALCESETDPLGRSIGDPLPHPKIVDGDGSRLTRWWERIRSSISARDWRALYQCDPKAPEGALLSWDLLRQRRCYESASCDARRARVGVAVDPSGGGRDTAGVIGGYLGEDGRAHFSHDRSGVMQPDAWGRAACEMAADIGADFIVYETNYGAAMVLLIIRTAWEALRREDPDRFGVLVPRLIPVHAKVGKRLRAEPIAQQWVENKCVTSAYLPDLESEWATFLPGQLDSPGRIDASTYLALELLPVPASGESNMDGAMEMAQTDLLAGPGAGDEERSSVRERRAQKVQSLHHLTRH